MDGDVAVVTLQNPPVNALGHVIREGLQEALAKLAADENARAAVLIGDGRCFSAGADLNLKEVVSRSQRTTLVASALKRSFADKIGYCGVKTPGRLGVLQITVGCQVAIAKERRTFAQYPT